MGGCVNNTQRLVWLCTIIACLFLFVAVENAGYKVSAAESEDSDLVFDPIELSNSNSHHRRIHRRTLSSPTSVSDNQLNSSPPVEQQHWLTHTVDRIKRSINNLFSSSKNEVEHQKSKKEQIYQRRKHHKRSPQGDETGQQEAEDEYDDDVNDDLPDEDEGGDEFNTNNFQDFSKPGDNSPYGGFDDEDNYITSGDKGSGEVDKPYTTLPTTHSSNPIYIRFIFTLHEPYHEEYMDRNSDKFRDLANRIRRSVEDLYQNVPGSQAATIVQIEKDKSDPFKIQVTLDMDSVNYSDKNAIVNVMSSNVANNRRIGNFTTFPDGFMYNVFEDRPQACENDELSCKNGQCVPADSRCNGINDCNDHSDEAGCTTESPTWNEPTTRYLDEGSGDGDEATSPPVNKCRADDVVRCSDGSRLICEVQLCDGLPDCSDGGDEKNCTHNDCATGEFSCDLRRCLPLSKRCDRQPDCDDQTDEQDCPGCEGDQFLCDGSRCIDRAYVCNGGFECSDGTDERNCPVQGCQPHEVDCQDGRCLPGDVRCNGQIDCRNGIDERNCSENSDPWLVNKCPDPSDFQCAAGFCIMGYKRCNGIWDCPSGSDEDNCPTSDTCADGEIKCQNGECVYGYTCDSIIDCPDGSDEEKCGNCTSTNFPEFQCSDGECVDMFARCNGRIDCRDGSDEQNCVECPSDQFRCSDGTCLDGKRRCDGFADCKDSSDEDNCAPPATECKPNEFMCDNQCISESFRCDGFKDCEDNMDELNCTTRSCPPGSTSCDKGTNCVHPTQICDGHADCYDRSDELNCPKRCESHQFACRGDRVCLPNYLKCNGRQDCSDGSDEENCVGCRNDQFECVNGNCIDSNLRCNRRNDCGDNSDEFNCPTPRPTDPPITSRPTYYPPISCPYGQQLCESRDQCINSSQFCDGSVDCRDMSDESNCVGNLDGLNLKTYPSKQEIRENIYKPDREVVFQCRDEGPIRAPVRWSRANGQPLPPNSRDNQGRLEIPDIKVEHGGTYVCEAVGYENLPGSRVSVELHVDKWTPPLIFHPKACGLHEATCANGDCISRNLVCNGQYDCTDGSDEIRCNLKGCEPNEFQCANKKCVYKSWRCDSQDDCGDGSDEENCAPPQPGSLCASTEFSCHSRNMCIPKTYHCDWQKDCADGSDEIGCVKPVIAPPKPEPMVHLNVGETFILSCTAVAVPVPEIVWRLNWHHVPEKCTSTSENGIGTLTCANIQIEDQGAYSCEAINIRGTTFLVPDTILTVEQQTVCQAGYFNSEARSQSECIRCFCFGHTSSCQSADLYIYQFQPPFDTLKLLGVHVDPRTNAVEIRDEPIYRNYQPQLIPVGRNGLTSTLPQGVEPDQPNVLPYFTMPENYHGNQLKSYGGYLRYNVLHTNRGSQTPGPDVILTGNGYTLLHQAQQTPNPYTSEKMAVRFFYGEWVIRSDSGPERLASREEIMMTLADINNILIKLQYNEGALNTTIRNIEMDSAATPNSNLGSASYVEHCQCPVGYDGFSCEKCAPGFIRHKSGPWLGQCYKEEKTCPPGTYSDGRDCQICPCPHTNPSNQFARTCSRHPDGGVICDCPPGYVGRNCESCAPGHIGNPLIPGDQCRPVDTCDAAGTSSTGRDGDCRCKENSAGPTCNQCKANTFHLSTKNQFGCIACFCMGITTQCTSSNWYRDQIASVFTSSINDFKLVDPTDVEPPLTSGIQLNHENREIVHNNLPISQVYYWSLPSRYLGNKVTSYGGNLRYTLKSTPGPGGQSSRNAAADVELVSKNNIRLLYYAHDQSQSINTGQTFVVPLLEQFWQRQDGQTADREHLLMALADLEAIYIKANYYTNTRDVSLSSISLDIASERNTGSSERALEVEQCQCQPGYKGLSCEDCDFGFTRSLGGIYLGVCEPCNCNGQSNDCDAETGECYNCRGHTTGENCEQCERGYDGDPTKGIPCQYGGTERPCTCDPRGSTSTSCYNGVCSCKRNVEGNNCDRCRLGTFGLNSTNIDGCEVCFCSGVASECTESNYYIEQIPYQIIDSSEFSLTDQNHRMRITDGFDVNLQLNEISHTFRPSNSERLFWSLPATFTGNKITSYGGRLEFMQKYTERPYARYVPDQDIIITGNGVTIYWNHPVDQQPEHLNKVSVPLHPNSNWHRIDQNRDSRPASREDILIVLANIESILVRATQSSDTATAYLSDITLDAGVEQYTGQSRANNIEVCRCPEGYRGSSCESCVSGYYRDVYFDESKPLGSCTRCPCQNAVGCNLGPDRRVVCQCLPGYSGRLCETSGAVQPPPPPPPGPDPTRPPTIDVTIITPQLDIHEVGSSVTVNCMARSRATTRIVRVHWTKDGGELSPNAIDDGRGILVITNLQVSDSGRYICEAEDGYSIVTSSFTLNVGPQREVRPVVSVNSPFIDVQEGQPAQVQCASSGIPIPDLRLERTDGQPLNPRHSFENGILRILQAQRADSGYYRCIASNRVGTAEGTFQIEVRSSLAPILRPDIQPSYYNGSSDETVTLRCVASGDIERITWSKENGQLPYNSREDNGILTIYRARPEDSGIYVCTVTTYTGTSGSQRATVHVSESGGTYPVSSVRPERITTAQGSTVEIRCDASGTPAPTIKWTKLGSELGPNAEQVGPILYIRNVRVEDRGVYICVASNDLGLHQASSMVEVTRLEAPRLEIYPSESQTIVAGNQAILQCRPIAGEPAPTLTWTRSQGRPFSSKIEQMSGGVLRFSDITQNEGGEYICTAVNEAGRTTATAVIVVHTRPEIYVTPNQDVISKNINDHLMLECQGTGTPQPSVTWHKQDDYLRETSSFSTSAVVQSIAVHEINNLRKEDQGIYICTARNEAGVTERRVQVIVDTLPQRGDITGNRQRGGEDATSSGGFKDNETPNRPYPPELEPKEFDEQFTAPVGTGAELRCRINNNDETQPIYVSWVRANNASLPPDAYVRGGILYIDNVQPSAAGIYKCIGTDNTGKVVFSLNSHLEVISPPKITLTPQRQVVHPGDNARIQCTATGEQPITIMWLPINREMPASVYTRDGHIQFNNIQLNDAGRYRCTARNSAGEADSVADVVVEENIHTPVISAENRVHKAPTGSTVRLRCRAHSPVDRRNIRWFREQLPISTNSSINGEVLTIYGIRSNDQGRYYCEVPTPNGSSSDFIDLQVIDSSNNSARPPQPTLYISPPEVDRLAGEHLDLVCQSNEPGVITTWSKLSDWLGENVRDVGGTLRFNSLRRDNTGVYRCEATGHQGVYHRDYNLNVIDDAEAQDDNPIEVKRAERGSTVILDCRTDLEEPVSYSWTKQGDILERNTETDTKNIQLNSIGSSQAGMYVCSANNGRRSIDVPIILVVTGIVPYFTQAPNSYLTLHTFGDSYIQFNFDISFKPENGHGIILYNGNLNKDKRDFISLALVQSVPQFRFNLGLSTVIVTGDAPVSNREWHTVKILRNRKKVLMYVDGKGPFVGEAEGRYVGLDLTEPLFLGGVPDYEQISKEAGVFNGFVGCLSLFKIGHSHVDLLQEAINKTGITSCETCSENSCENQGACQEALTKDGFTCICSAGFSGPTCSKIKAESCQPHTCQTGRCIDTENSFECKCPLGRTGPHCEHEITVNEPAFRNDGYLAYNSPAPSRRLTISMKVKPRSTRDGILLYCAETEEGYGNFISLAIIDKHWEFSYDAGNGATVIRHPEEVKPGEWSVLTASRSWSGARLTLNGGSPVTGSRASGNFKTLNLQTPLYIGGYDKQRIKVKSQVKTIDGFNGCISDMQFTGTHVDLIRNITDSSNVEDCNAGGDDVDNNIYSPSSNVVNERSGPSVPFDNRQTGCSQNPCLNNGQCYPLSPIEYQCTCPAGYTGKNCERQFNVCEIKPCRNEGVCRAVGQNYTCDCNLGYKGRNCELRSELRNDAHFDGNGYLEFNRNMLSHENEDEDETIALELSTNSSNGLIFWHGQTSTEDGQGRDYISLALQDGYLEYSFDLGSGAAIIENKQVRVNDGQRHAVILKRSGRDGSIEIDHTYDEPGTAEGITFTMNCSGNIYLGGTPNVSLMTGGRFTKGFTGCIHGFELQNSKTIDLGVKAIGGLNVKSCSRFEGPSIDNNII